MRRRFTIQPAEVRQYYREGFLLKKRFIQSDLLQQAIMACEKLAKQKSNISEDYGYICMTDDVLSFLKKDSGLVNLLESLNLWRAMGTLLGSQHLAYHFSNLTIKVPGQEGMIRWHRDFENQYIPLVTSDFLRVFIPLTHFDRTYGAPTIIRESNKVTDKAVKLSKKLNVRTTRRFPLAEQLYCSSGDIIFMHPKTRHCSEQNYSDNPRINLIMQAGIAKRPVSHIISNKESFGTSRLQLKCDGG